MYQIRLKLITPNSQKEEQFSVKSCKNKFNISNKQSNLLMKEKLIGKDKLNNLNKLEKSLNKIQNIKTKQMKS